MFNTPKTIGLDIGQESFKAIQLEDKLPKGSAPAVHKACLLDCRAEGIIGAHERQEHLHSWFREYGLEKAELTIGMPQFLCTTEVYDFPPGSDQDLASMVAYETRQLAGLSEDTFTQDYQPIKPVYDWQNPALIAICKESLIDDQAQLVASCHLNVADLSLTGVALANAYITLYPEQAASPELQLLLNVQNENATLVIIGCKQPLFIISLMTGAQNYQLLTAEVQQALNEWRTHNSGQIRVAPIGQVNISGDAATTPGLTGHLTETLGCPCQIVGPPTPENKSGNPIFMTAYGLALQAAGLAPVPMSFASDAIRWSSQRRKRFNYLVASLIIIMMFTIGFLTKATFTLKADQAELQLQKTELNQCKNLIPKLEELTNKTGDLEKRLIPIVSKGNRAARILRAITELSNARNKKDWFIYLADADTYNSSTYTPERPDTQSTLPDDVPAMHTLIVAGYTSLQLPQPYKPVRDIVQSLNQSAEFKNVDLLPESEQANLAMLYERWQKLFEKHIDGSFLPFALKAPFQESDIISNAQQQQPMETP